MPQKTDRLVIRCSNKTKRLFKIFVSEHDYRDFEEALLELLKWYKPPSFL